MNIIFWPTAIHSGDEHLIINANDLWFSPNQISIEPVLFLLWQKEKLLKYQIVYNLSKN